MHFTTSEIIRSVISATLFGAFYAIFCSSLTALSKYISAIMKSVFAALRRGKLPSPKSPILDWQSKSGGVLSEALVFIRVLFFGLLFILLSYYSLDGDIRLYMFIILLVSVVLFSFLFDRLIRPVSNAVFGLFYRLFIYVTMIPLWLFLRLKCIFFRKIPKKTTKKPINPTS